MQKRIELLHAFPAFQPDARGNFIAADNYGGEVWRDDRDPEPDRETVLDYGTRRLIAARYYNGAFRSSSGGAAAWPLRYFHVRLSNEITNPVPRPYPTPILTEGALDHIVRGLADLYSWTAILDAGDRLGLKIPEEGAPE